MQSFVHCFTTKALFEKNFPIFMKLIYEVLLPVGEKSVFQPIVGILGKAPLNARIMSLCSNFR